MHIVWTEASGIAMTTEIEHYLIILLRSCELTTDAIHNLRFCGIPSCYCDHILGSLLIKRSH